MDVRIERIDPKQVNVYWCFLADLLRPSLLQQGSPRSLETVRTNLLNGQMAAASIHFPNGAGVIVLSMQREGDKLFCWVYALVGRAKLKYRAFKAKVAEVLGLFEEEAKKAGCAEMRMRGRNWSWLPGYESMGDDRLRKVLV